MIARWIFGIGVVSASLVCNAQSLNDFRDKLSLFERNDDQEFVRYANVVVNEDDSAKEAFEALRAQNAEYDKNGVEIVTKPGTKPKPQSVEGYRIGIFFDNGASARANARRVVERCDSLFADIPVSMSYDNPYFKVSAGYCTSQQEAVMMLNRIQRHFPNAYLMRDVITTDNIIEVRAREQRIIAERERIADSLAMAAAVEGI